MLRPQIIIAIVTLILSGLTGWLVSSPSCYGMYKARSRAVPVDAKIVAVDQRVIKTRTGRKVNSSTKTRTVEDLDVVGTFQGHEVTRSVQENHKGAKAGDARTFLVDPEDPELDIPEGPAWFNVVPGAMVSAGLALGALYLLAGALKRRS